MGSFHYLIFDTHLKQNKCVIEWINYGTKNNWSKVWHGKVWQMANPGVADTQFTLVSASLQVLTINWELKMWTICIILTWWRHWNCKTVITCNIGILWYIMKLWIWTIWIMLCCGDLAGLNRRRPLLLLLLLFALLLFISFCRHLPSKFLTQNWSDQEQLPSQLLRDQHPEAADSSSSCSQWWVVNININCRNNWMVSSVSSSTSSTNIDIDIDIDLSNTP